MIKYNIKSFLCLFFSFPFLSVPMVRMGSSRVHRVSDRQPQEQTETNMRKTWDKHLETNMIKYYKLHETKIGQVWEKQKKKRNKKEQQDILKTFKFMRQQKFQFSFPSSTEFTSSSGRKEAAWCDCRLQRHFTLFQSPSFMNNSDFCLLTSCHL